MLKTGMIVRGAMTVPTVQLVETSGFRNGLPPVVTFAWDAVGFGMVPIEPGLAPCAIQIARRLASFSGAAPAHGSVVRAVNPVATGANNSTMLGARTAL